MRCSADQEIFIGAPVLAEAEAADGYKLADDADLAMLARIMASYPSPSLHPGAVDDEPAICSFAGRRRPDGKRRGAGAGAATV